MSNRRAMRNLGGSLGIFYSEVYGGGVYSWYDGCICNPLRLREEIGLHSPRLRNLLSGEKCYMRSLYCAPEQYEKYRDIILNPPASGVAIWPIDFLSGNLPFCTLPANGCFTDKTASDRARQPNCGLVFKDRELRVVDGETLYRRYKRLPWQREHIRDMAVGIVHAVERLNTDGYIYQDMRLSRFFFEPEGGVLVHYSPLAYRKDWQRKMCSPKLGEYPLEFMDPAYVTGKIKYLDYASQNYSLAALMFYLLCGRHPYDGRLLAGYQDCDAQSHCIKFRDYYKHPVFIFDPSKPENHLGSFPADRQTRAKWDECPQTLKSLFLKALCWEKAEERGRLRYYPSPSVWLDSFEQLGWAKVL